MMEQVQRVVQKNGVAKQISNDEPRALYTHCYGHVLNLNVGDCIKQCKVIKLALEVVGKISMLFKKSPKRDLSFDKIKSALAPDTLRCPTRWSFRVATLKV